MHFGSIDCDIGGPDQNDKVEFLIFNQHLIYHSAVSNRASTRKRETILMSAISFFLQWNILQTSPYMHVLSI